MPIYELVMPKLGESIVEATIIRWLKEPGDKIEIDEPVLEIATDKVDSDVPSPVEGVLKEIKFQADDVVPVGEVIALIEVESLEGIDTTPELPNVEESPEPQPVISENGQARSVEPAVVTSPAPPSTQSVPDALQTLLMEQPVPGRFYSPLVMNIARQENIPMDVLDRLKGSGKEGRVTKKDILAFVKKLQENKLNASDLIGTTTTAPTPTPPQATITPSATPSTTTPSAPKTPPIPQHNITYSDGEVEIIEMDRMRKIIAQNMVASKHTSAHVTSFVEADVTNLVRWRNKMKNEFLKKYGTKLTFTHIFIEALAKVLREYPLLNSSVDGDKIIMKKRIHIGIAVALPDFNLIVPVLRDADTLNLVGIARIANDLTERARKGKLRPEEIQGGTYTLSNVGSFGNLMGTPVILQPQVGILAVGTIRKVPAVIETSEGDMIAIRHKMFLSHSYDHRIIDGALGGAFVRRVADLLEQWDVNRGI